jgi:acyl carrier protein
MTVPTQDSAVLEVVTREIIDLVSGEAEDAKPTAESELADVGLDSLKFMSVVFKIETRYDIELQEEDADDLHTIGDLAALVVSYLAEQS